MSRRLVGVGMWIVGALVASSSACAPPAVTTSFNSRVEVANAAPVRRLLVFEDVESPDIGHDMHMGFAAAMADRLSMCGVAVLVLQAQSLDLDPAARIVASAQGFQADAVLLIQAAGGQIVEHRGSALIFELKLIEFASQRVTWRAKSQFVFSSSSLRSEDIDAGVSFGTSIVSRLRDDRVLTGCPAPAVGWPEIKSLTRCGARTARC